MAESTPAKTRAALLNGVQSLNPQSNATLCAGDLVHGLKDAVQRDQEDAKAAKPKK